MLVSCMELSVCDNSLTRISDTPKATLKHVVLSRPAVALDRWQLAGCFRTGRRSCPSQNESSSRTSPSER